MEFKFSSLEDRQLDAIAAAGRAAEYHLDEVAGVVMAKVVDAGTEGVVVEPGTVIVRVFMEAGSDPQSAIAKVYQFADMTQIVAVVVEPAKRRHWRERRRRIKAGRKARKKAERDSYQKV